MTRFIQVVALLGLADCAAHSSRHSARTLRPGQWQTVVAVDGIIFEHGRAYVVYPAPELAIRRGMGPGWDVGGKLGAGSVEASVRLARVDTPALAVALAPGMRFEFPVATNNGTDILRAVVFQHLVIEHRVGPASAVVGTATAALAVGSSATIFGGSPGPARLLAEPALGAGLRTQAGRVVLWPEVTVTVPYAFGDDFEAPLVQFGIGLEW